ncbi:MAG: L-histidine N(alpha)-methyltransferase [Bacteroidota bacterium]
MDDQITVSSPKMLEEVLDGLKREQKQLPSKYFYDERGSELFEEITEQDEYYLTRTELDIMQNNMPDIIRTIGSDVVLMELGSGSSKKTRLLLDHLSCITAYIPVEISDQFLELVVQSLTDDYPDLTVNPISTDYTQPFDLPEINQRYSQLVVFYPGSTIGNFRPTEAKQFLNTISDLMEPEDAMLIGVDLKKDTDVLEAAYNDRKGVTARFNKNILRHINRKLDSNFNPDNFKHHTFLNADEGRIEMHLIAKEDHSIKVAGEKFSFQEGESIHTENSYKYSLDEFEELVYPWFTVEEVWTDSNNYFSFQYLQRA